MEAEDNWNCQLTNVSHTARDGKTFLFSFRCFVSLSLSLSLFLSLSDAKMYSLTLLYRRRLRIKGKHSSLENCYLRGSKIRMVIVPDMLKNAPMFKKIDPRTKSVLAGGGKK